MTAYALMRLRQSTRSRYVVAARQSRRAAIEPGVGSQERNRSRQEAVSCHPGGGYRPRGLPVQGRGAKLMTLSETCRADRSLYMAAARGLKGCAVERKR
jgi:hypothetical protein